MPPVHGLTSSSYPNGVAPLIQVAFGSPSTVRHTPVGSYRRRSEVPTRGLSKFLSRVRVVTTVAVALHRILNRHEPPVDDDPSARQVATLNAKGTTARGCPQSGSSPTLCRSACDCRAHEDANWPWSQPVTDGCRTAGVGEQFPHIAASAAACRARTWLPAWSIERRCTMSPTADHGSQVDTHRARKQ